jgi:hypothetical protein
MGAVHVDPCVRRSVHARYLLSPAAVGGEPVAAVASSLDARTDEELLTSEAEFVRTARSMPGSDDLT